MAPLLPGGAVRLSFRHLPTPRGLSCRPFPLAAPDGADAVDVALEYLIPGEKGGYGAGPAATARLAILNWYLVTLYPEGRPVRDIPIRASLTLPQGWQAGTALPVESRKDNTIQYK